MNTTVVTVDTVTARDFLNQHHLQGHQFGTYYLGLQDNATGRLVAVMSTKEAKGVSKVEEGAGFEVTRYATNMRVIGGFEHLISHVQETYDPDYMVSFSDNCISTGTRHVNAGFRADKYLKPECQYVSNGRRFLKTEYRTSKFKRDKDLRWEAGLSQDELALLNKLYRIWDAGSVRWVRRTERD